MTELYIPKHLESSYDVGFTYKEKENNYEILIEEMEKNYQHTWDWLMWTRNDDNVAMLKSGWGDGLYATYIGFDKDGSICRLVTDFMVLD